MKQNQVSFCVSDNKVLHILISIIKRKKGKKYARISWIEVQERWGCSIKGNSVCVNILLI